MSFANTGLSEDVLRAVKDTGYEHPTPIQAQAIPLVLMGRDILACAQTGTGKTASFTLPMIDILAHGRAKMRMPRSLILEPTRELAAQVAENFDTYGKYHKLTKALLIGGTDMKKQAKVLDAGTDVLIATPGRLLDMFERGHLLMRDVKILVIDEADRMLDMGFIPDIEKIVSMLPPIRQTLFFSATMAPEIKKLADKFLMNPKVISVSAPASTADTVTQGLLTLQPGGQYHGMEGKKQLKRDALRKLIGHEDVSDAIVFCNRKADISSVYKSLTSHGITAGQLHGDMSQPARTEMLAGFKDKKFNILVCSDVAARGLDVKNLSHVFNFDVPSHAEDYVHRIGRTGRAGKEGHAYTIALPEDGKYVAAIEKLIGKPIPKLSLEGFEAGQLSEGGRGSERPERGGRGGRDRKPRDGQPLEDHKPAERQATPEQAKPEQANPEQAAPTEHKVAGHKPAPAQHAPRKDEARRDHHRSERGERGGHNERGGRGDHHARGSSRDDDRSRDIHNQVCDGHMPAFLMNPPGQKPTPKPAAKSTAPATKTDETQAPAKKRPRRRSPAKKPDAPKAQD
ncbi:MAG: DEAD/DEAH box helicase [Rhodospirillales bacterium]|nr:DEAD/DEAH box helicase [Rhodospirillales bacterium]